MEIIPFRESKLTHLLMPIMNRAGLSGVAMIACVNPQVDDYDETLSILSNASLASKIKEFADLGRTATQQVPGIFPPSSSATNASAQVSTSATTTTTTATTSVKTIKLEELKDYKDKNAGKRKRHDSTLAAPPASTTTAANKENRKRSVTSVAATSKTTTTTTTQVATSEPTEDADEQGSERKRLRREVETLKEANAMLQHNNLSREAEIRAEVSEEMFTRSAHMLDQIQDLRTKLAHYESQDMPDVTKSCKKVRRNQIQAQQANVAKDLQEAEDELERVKTEYEIEIFKLKMENKKLNEELALYKKHGNSTSTTSQELFSLSKLKKVSTVRMDQENNTNNASSSSSAVAQEFSQRFQLQRSTSKKATDENNVILMSGKKEMPKKSPARSPLSPLSNSPNVAAAVNPSPMVAKLNAANINNHNNNNELKREFNANRSPSRMRSGTNASENSNNGAASGNVPYFKRLRSHFVRA